MDPVSPGTVGWILPPAVVCQSVVSPPTRTYCGSVYTSGGLAVGDIGRFLKLFQAVDMSKSEAFQPQDKSEMLSKVRLMSGLDIASAPPWQTL